MKKKLLISIIIFLTICQLNTKIIAYTIDEVKEKVEFEEVTEEPENYDIEIDAEEELILDERIPCIESSIEKVLYDENGLLDIDFLNPNSTNENEEWKKVQGIVSVFFKMFLYIAIVAMLTILIYIAITIVVSSVTARNSKMTLGAIARGEQDPEKGVEHKEFIERWFISVVMLASIVVIINLMVNFSGAITDIADDYKLNEDNNEKITFYVKNSKGVVKSEGTSSSSSSEDEENKEDDKNNDDDNNDSASLSADKTTASSKKVLKLSADSDDNSGTAAERQRIVDQASSLDTLGSGGGYCEQWVELVYRKALPGRSIPNYCCAGYAGSQCIVSTSTDDIVPGAVVFGNRSNPTVMCSCGNDAAHVGIYIGNGTIASNVGGISTCSVEYWSQAWGFRGWGWLGGAEDLGDGAKSDGGGSGGTSGDNEKVEIKTIDYTFKTGLEGAFMFQSQYDWEESAGKNFANIIGGASITIFKIFLYVIFLFRMLLIALITAVAPIVVLVAIFKKLKDEKQKNSILRKWIKLYMYLVLLRPIIALIYYMLVKSNTYLVTEVPFYTVLVVIIMIVVIVWSIRRVFRSL